jgi:hypothetical protein
MKKNTIFFIAIVILITISLISFGAPISRGRGGEAEPQLEQPNLLEQPPLNVASLNPGLVELKALRLFIPVIPPALAGLGISVERRLTQADSRLAALFRNGVAAGIAEVPQIVITITKLNLIADRPVYCVRTTLHEVVPVLTGLIPTPTSIDIDVWSRADTVQAASLAGEPAAVAGLINKQINEFISDFVTANTPVDQPLKETPAAQTNISEPNNTQTNQGTQAAYPYIASKSQLVFHKIECGLAKSILPRNRIYFKTREEAVAAGKKPCSVCKP